MEPQLEQSGGSWTARYPEADWSVSAPTEEQVRQRLGEEVVRRQGAGENALAYADDVYRRHLRAPVAGVYAMKNELYRELVRGHWSEIDVERAFEEAELARREGRPYTKADYFRGG